MDNQWIVHKFGGSSVGTPDGFRRIAALLSDYKAQPFAVVVSALGGITDQLYGLMQTAIEQGSIAPGIAAVRERHLEHASALGLDLPDSMDADLEDIRDLLRAVQLTRHADQALADVIAGYGERWCARMMRDFLNANGFGTHCLEADEFIIAEDTGLGPEVDFPASRTLLEAQLPEQSQQLVVTGFIARKHDGRPRTLGRNGSDYSASIMARLLGAKEIHIWTDVPGVLSADPRIVAATRPVQTLTYDEAAELAYFGAKVLHPKTMVPAIAKSIPIHIGSTHEPHAPGTWIGPESQSTFAIKGITAINNVALINLEGAGLIGVPGTARRVFSRLELARISVVAISQASSEHSICIAIDASRIDDGEQVLRDEFAREIANGQVKGVRCETDVALVAVVGAAMAGHPGIAARFFDALTRCAINIKAIAQGSSEKNISAVVEKKDAERAVRAAHSAFCLSRQKVSVAVLGTGNVGAELIDQLKKQAGILADRMGIDLQIAAIANTRRLWLGYDQTAAYPEGGSPKVDLDAVFADLNNGESPHRAIIDCSASQQLAEQHARWLANGFHVVTANKKAKAGPMHWYRAIADACRTAQTDYGFEATVGAGLPIIGTLRDLIDTGDEILEIEGMLSGTLAYLFNRYDGQSSFADLVSGALDEGYTEPDPRDDLSGMDVARKLVILARELGATIEVDDIEVENLVHESLRDLDLSAYLAQMASQDDDFSARHASAAAQGKVLRYVARLVPGESARCSLAMLDSTHPFALASPTDNVVKFRTRRYDANPLIVQGPGAGREVTAAGVFGDLLRVVGALREVDRGTDVA